LLLPRPLTSPLFPYTTLFRSEKRDAAATIVVPFNPATHHCLIRDLPSMCVVCEMFARQGAAHLFDESPEQHHQIVLRISDDLELDRKSTRLNSSHQIISYAVF